LHPGILSNPLFRTILARLGSGFVTLFVVSLIIFAAIAVLPGEFPERAFSVLYAHKDLKYALQLARDTGVDARGAAIVDEWFQQAIDSGLGEKYHPVISRLIAGQR